MIEQLVFLYWHSVGGVIGVDNIASSVTAGRDSICVVLVVVLVLLILLVVLQMIFIFLFVLMSLISNLSHSLLC